MSRITFSFQMSQLFLRGHGSCLASMKIIKKDILFSLHGWDKFEHGQKTQFRVVFHLRRPVDSWTVRKQFKKFFWDDGGLCSVLKRWIFIFLIWWFIVRGSSSWLWRRVSECWIAAKTADKWASLLCSSNCRAKTHMSLCQTGVSHWRFCSWLSWSSNGWSSNVYAALGTGATVRSTVNKGTLCTWWLAFGLTAEPA